MKVTKQQRQFEKLQKEYDIRIMYTNKGNKRQVIFRKFSWCWGLFSKWKPQRYGNGIIIGYSDTAEVISRLNEEILNRMGQRYEEYVIE